MYGPILVGLADVQCEELQTASGMELSELAVAVSNQEFGVDDWRSHRAILTQAYCLKRGNVNLEETGIDAEKVSAALAGIIKQWGETSFFSKRASLQLNEILRGREL